MARGDDTFLRLTFEGGRFARLHALPVDALAELVTFQQLIERVARILFLKAHDGERERVPKGFLEAARLYLAASEENCFTADLRRPSDITPWSGATTDDLQVFESARDLSIEALRAASTAPLLPMVNMGDFPHEAIRLLSDIGRRLLSDEYLLVRNPSDLNHPARVDQSTRARLASYEKRPLIREAELDGEVDDVNDHSSTVMLRVSSGVRVELPFESKHRAILIDALSQRPSARVRVKGEIVFVDQTPKKMNQAPFEIESFDVERASEIQKVRDRLTKLRVEVSDGWLDGEGLAPKEPSIDFALRAISRLLVDHEDITRPKLFPTPTGEIQAEWTWKNWAAELVFHADGVVVADATHIESGDSSLPREFNATSLVDDARPLHEWLERMLDKQEPRDV